jgi:hypothetical protein
MVSMPLYWRGKGIFFPLDLISVDLEERVAIGQHPNYLTYLRIKDIGKFIGIVTIRYICKLRKF